MVYGVTDCPDCGKQISARAIVCIHCGGPLLQGQRQQRLSVTPPSPPLPTSVGDLADHAAAEEPGPEEPPAPPATKEESKGLDWFLALILSPIGIGLLLMFFLGLRSGRRN